MNKDLSCFKHPRDLRYCEPSKPLDPVIYKLRKRRYDVGVTIKSLSKLMGYDPHTVRQWECGVRKPSYQGLSDWCEALGVELTVVDVEVHHADDD